MASKTEAVDVAATTAEYKFSEGKERSWMGLDRYFWKDGDSLAYEANHDNTRRSETMPMNSPGTVAD